MRLDASFVNLNYRPKVPLGPNAPSMVGSILLASGVSLPLLVPTSQAYNSF